MFHFALQLQNEKTSQEKRLDTSLEGMVLVDVVEEHVKERCEEEEKGGEIRAFFKAYASKRLEAYTSPRKGKTPRDPILPFKTLHMLWWNLLIINYILVNFFYISLGYFIISTFKHV
ncbi:hypothetical protein L484_018701 [Morus notabilis]|uniref:Uncharacterized protein n=1 Tax=Morus notabilis TaxID=981085 RepID=W9SNJ3_9ROSA|nr:hypothetical protein L484_018701 [Morus notabilis]